MKQINRWSVIMNFVNKIVAATALPVWNPMKTLSLALAILPLLAVGVALAETPVVPQDEDLLTPQERVLSRKPYLNPEWTWMTERQAILLLKTKGFTDVFRVEKVGSSWRGKARKGHASYHVVINRYAEFVAHMDKKSRESYAAVAEKTKRDAANASKAMLATLNGPIAVPISQNATTVLTPGKPVLTVMGEVGWTWVKENHAVLMLKAKGYRNIGGLKRDARGIWRGKAIHDGLALRVGIDIHGNVEAQPAYHGGLAQASPSD
jgi:hypothetical protein